MSFQSRFFSVLASVLLFALCGTAAADHGGGSHINVNLNVPSTDPDGNFTVTWTNNAEPPDEIQFLERKPQGGSYSSVYSGYSGSKSFTNHANGTFHFRVRYELCFGFICGDEYSDSQSILVGTVQPPSAPGPLTVPTTATDGGSGASYTVSWTASATGPVDEYRLEQKSATGGFFQVYAGTATSYQVSSVLPGTYEYRVRACNQGGCSGYSATSDPVTVMANNVTSGLTSARSAAAVGTMLYGIDVATDGDAIVSVPLELIPGVAGFRPSLSIEYDSGRGPDRLEQSLPEDTLGYGWRLAGLSEIRRCVVNQSSTASIQLTTADSLCLDGMPLVMTSGTHLAVGAVYRTLIESYIKIEIKGTSGDFWFEATMPNGTIREYGNSVDSRVNQSGGVDFQWSINKATSTENNVINYAYYFDESNGTNYITNIEYTDAEVEFLYETRSDAAAVSIGSASQTRAAYLHTVKVKYDGVAIRDYLFVSEVVSSRRRVNKIQLCGYNEAGSSYECLNELDLDWLTPASAIAGVPIVVDGLTDGLGALYQLEYGTITGNSHSFLFTERPFGNGALPVDTQLLPGPGARRHVATKLRRDNGLGGFHDTTYAYQDVGVESTRHWGFLGFYAQRVTDAESGVVTYAQSRVDYPYFGEISRFHQYDAIWGSETKTFTRTESDFDQFEINHGSTSTIYPYVEKTIDFVLEGTTQLGASQDSVVVTMVGGLVDQIESTMQIGTGVTEGTPGSTWGDIPTYTLSGVEHTTERTVEFNNRTSAGEWLIGFTENLVSESWPGAASGNGIVRDVTMTPITGSMNVDTMTRFPNSLTLTLLTDFDYDTRGRLTRTTISGDNVTARSNTVTGFTQDRYPSKIANQLGHETTFGSYDARFGTIASQGHYFYGASEWTRDEFGRVISAENRDDVDTALTYIDCAGTCPLVYGISPAYKVERTVKHTVTTLAPKRFEYYDLLGRLLRSEIESFDGTSFSKQDTKYDLQGRVEKTSLPYFSGTAHEVVYGYDERNRIDSVTRPDGSSTATAFAATGNTVIVTVTDNVKKADGTSDGTQVKRSEFNVLAQLEKTTDGYGSSSAVETTYSYDALGNMTIAEVAGGAAGTAMTTFAHDPAGNRTSITGPNIGTMTSDFNALWQVIEQTDNMSQVTTIEYDGIGRLKQRVSIDGTSTWTWDTATNGQGRLASRTNGNGFTEDYNYNTDGRISSTATKITPIGGGTETSYTTTHTYDTFGRLSTTTYPGSGFVLTRQYNARGYLSALKDGTTALKTFVETDAFGNSTEEDFGNGVTTLRTFDPKTGRLTGIDSTVGSTVIQDNDYAWRSNGTLESRIANPSSGHATTRKETFTYDPLNRLDLAETYINGSNTRDLDFSYDLLGNVKSKTSTLGTDTDVTGYAYGAGNAGPHAATSFSVDGVSRTLTYNGNGAVTRYDIAGTSDDRWIAYNAINQPTKIVVGTGLSDPSPVASDEFAYDPDGARYYRRTTWQDGGTRTEDVVTIGPVEIITDNIADEITRITKTRIGSSLMHVKVEGIETLPYYPWFQPRTEEFIEYAHRDHLGSIDVVTDENGNVLDDLEFEPFGGRKESDWAGQISASGLSSLLERDWDRSPKIRGFTSHEHLDRTGLIHMNGRVFDPEIGRFLSPDIFVANRADSQAWNRYSYVRNSPMSATDPSGFIEQGVGATGGPDGDGLVVPPLPPWWVRVGLEQMMWGNSLQPPVETGYIVEEHDLVAEPNVEVDYNSQTVENLSVEFQEKLASESFQRAVRVAMGAASSEMTRPRNYSNRDEPLPVRYQQSTGAMIVKKSVLRDISDSAYRKIPGNDDFALGEVSSDVANGNMNGGWRRGGIAGNMHGHTEAISGAEAVVIRMAPFESRAELLEGNLRAFQQTFGSINPTVPLIISAGEETFLIEGTTGPIAYDGF